MRRCQQGGRARSDDDSQLLPSHQWLGNIEPTKFLGGNSEADVLRVGLRPGGNADDFTALVKNRAPTIARRDGTRQLILQKAVHTPNLADQSIADAKIIALGCADYISPGGHGCHFTT